MQQGGYNLNPSHSFLQCSKEVTSTFKVYRPAAGGAPGYAPLPKHKFEVKQDVSIMLDIYVDQLLEDTGEGKGMVEDIGVAADGAEDTTGKRGCPFVQGGVTYFGEVEQPFMQDEGEDWTYVRSAIYDRGDNSGEGKLTNERKVGRPFPHPSSSGSVLNCPAVGLNRTLWPSPAANQCAGHHRGPTDTSGPEEEL